MHEYAKTFDTTIKNDGLHGGGDGFPLETKNITVNANILRGMILASATPDGTYSLATAADTDKNLVIASEDFTFDSDHTVTTAFSSGKFNQNKLTLSVGVDIKDFELALRRQNIILTTLCEIS